MALSQRLDLRHTQTLVMTPQLQQAIKLLQLSNVELGEYVDREIERNPLLDRDDGEPREGSGGEGEERASADDRPAPSADVTGTDRLTSGEHYADGGDAPLDTDYENVWTNDTQNDGVEAEKSSDGVHTDWSVGGGRGFDGEDDLTLEHTLSGHASLREHLLEQVNVELADPADRLIGTQLIEWLDEAGYLAADLDQLAGQLGCGRNKVEAVLARLQRFDPAGIFARDLKECLALQLRERDRLDPAMQALLDNLALLGQRDFSALLDLCGVDMDDLADMIAEIKALNPKPALSFDHEVAQTVTPDVIMRPQNGGGWIVELNSDTLPRVLVNHRYYSQVSTAVRNKGEKDYIAECFATANWLAKSLHQRATTILKVATELVRQQDAFFAHGVQHLKPLILRDIAEAIGMHESTISRVTSNKFISTPRGVFELKYFFTASIQGANGAAAHSAEAVRFRIKTLIDREPPDAILSDDRIVEILRADGVDIARRTVAKYREALRIPSSVQRRRAKSMRF
jgi:RNA polymerase sigma-54 factor